MTATSPVIVVMGVSGVGKSTIGSAVADRLGRPFLDADDLHPAANRVKMAQGRPLDDADRLPWLDLVAGAAAAGDVVVACSALRRNYRERLQAGIPDVFFVELDVDRAELEQRVRRRSHEYMPPSLLESQLATLEPLMPDEPGIRVAADKPAADIVVEIVDQLNAVPSHMSVEAQPRAQLVGPRRRAAVLVDVDDGVPLDA